MAAAANKLTSLAGTKPQVVLPKGRDWMSTHSWVVNEAELVFFLTLTIVGLGG